MQNKAPRNEQIEAVQDYLNSELPEQMYYVPSSDQRTRTQTFCFQNPPGHEVCISWEFFQDCDDYAIALYDLQLAERIQEAGNQSQKFIVGWNGQATLKIQYIA